MEYTPAEPGERCTRCNDYASRIVAAKALCVTHFDAIYTHCRNATRRHILTPKGLTPDGFADWAALLDHGIHIGVITPDEAAQTWSNAREFAA